MKPTCRTLVVVGLAVTSLAGCKKKEAGAPAATGSAEPAPAAPPAMAPTPPAAPPVEPPAPAKAQPPAIAAPKGLFGCNQGDRAPLAGAQAKALPFKLTSCPTIPSVFGGLAWGMDAPTALKVSKAKQSAGYQGAVEGQLKVGKLRFTLGFNDVGHADSIFFATNQAAVDAMLAAWGPALKVKDLSDELMLWFNPAAQTRVEVKPDTSEPGRYYVRFYGYTPIAELFAADGLLSKPLIGAAPAKVAELVPDLIRVESSDAAAAKVAAMGLDDKAAAIASWAGADKGKAELVLLGTATKSFFNLSLRFKNDQLVEYGSLIDTMDDFRRCATSTPPRLAAALGAPTADSTFEDGEPTYVFAAPGGHKVVLRGTSDWHFDITK
ncbi:MAG: hypothetical protein R3B06_14810 [Kofleriaceae bacterium]